MNKQYMAARQGMSKKWLLVKNAHWLGQIWQGNAKQQADIHWQGKVQQQNDE